MSEVTHLRIIFPLGFNPKHLIKTFWDEGEEAFCGAVLWQNPFWSATDPTKPAFAKDMEVHVGVERETERSLLGAKLAVPAKGLLRGEFLRWEPLTFSPRRETGGWGWLCFMLRYDMDEGPETWKWEHTGDMVYTTGQAPEFYYAVERDKDAE